jgi:uncharacterized membrane protein YgdD (TMEM256/DUF423 family)
VSRWLAAAAALGALGVALGAFGAHGLRDRVSAGDLATWETAVLYHELHALALLALALFGAATGRPVRRPATLFVLGIALFSGSLYLLVASGARWLGAVTPLGGLCLIAGWLTLPWLRPPRPGA